MTAGKGRALLVTGGLLVLLSCLSCKGTIGAPYQGTTIPPNACTSAQVALSNPACQLTLGEWKYGYIAELQEQDWYSVNVGSNIDTRSIAHIIAGYFPADDVDGGIPDCSGIDGGPAFNTAVNLTMNVLMQDGQTSLATASDVHGTACPTPMNITFKYTTPDTSLIIILQDDTGTKVDTKHEYGIVADVLEDPDTNEPNDTPQTATPIPLGANPGGGQAGQNGGYLSTPGDVDYYSVVSPGPGNVLWVEVSQDPSVPSPPPHAYRLEYYVFAPDGVTQLAQGYAQAGSQYSPALVAIGDAILLNQAGPYYIEVLGYSDSNTVGAVPGDLNFKYLVKTIIVPLQDPTEPNNAYATAYAVNGGTAVPVGSNATVTGRTSYVGDADWYAVTLAPNPALALLHYKLTPGTTGGRFPALPTTPSRTLFVYTQAPDTPSCLAQDPTICLISTDGGTAAAIAESSCAETPSKCLQSYRLEVLPRPDGSLPFQANLKNFEANLQVAPHAAAVTYYFFLQAVGFDPSNNNGYWADDKDYSILFEHLAEPDVLEAIPDPPRMATLNPTPGPLVAGPVYLSYGIGQLNPGHTINDVIFGPEDYDGRGNDVDTYQIALPFSTEEAWQISWSIPSTDGTNPDYDLGFTLSFCDTRLDAGTGAPPCYAMVTAPQDNSSNQLGFGYTDQAIDSWWNPAAATIPDQVAYTQTASGGVVTTTVLPYACFCFEPRFANATSTSYFLMSVFPLNRTSWNLAPYAVTTGYSPYPYSFTNAAGTMTMCPDPCNFTVN
jgi:hypothetical protein